MMLLIIISITILCDIIYVNSNARALQMFLQLFLYICHNFNDWLFLIINLTIFVKIHFNYIKLHYIILNILYQ